MARLLPAVLAGLATGCRSQLAITAVALTPPTLRSNRADRWLHRPKRRWVAALPAVGELVGDKLPQAPARTAPGPLAGRIGLGALVGTILAARAGESQLPSALAGAAAAAATSYAGPVVRARLAAAAGSDLPGALAEDAVAIGLARLAVRS